MLAARRLERLEGIRKAYPEADIQIKQADVTEFDQVEAVVEEAKAVYGRIDVLFNNAGIMPTAPLAAGHREDWKNMLDINVMGVLNGIAATLPIMEQQQSGHIIATDSVAGHVVYPESAVYCGTKFAVRAITEGLRKEESVDNNIRATIISPGAVDTELKDHITDEEIKQGIGNLKAMDADAIARAIAYAVNEPDDVAVNEILIRPTAQQ